MNRQELEKKALTFEYLQKINFILRKIRLNDKGMFETASSAEQVEEKVLGKLTVEKVDFPNDGGVFTYYEGLPKMKGFPDGETVERIDEAKKMVMRILWGIYRSSKIKFIFALPVMQTLCENLILSYWEYIKSYRFKPERYCTAVREFYRVFDLLHTWKRVDGESDLWDMIRDDFCITMESDDAYRYRLQIVLPELNKENLRKNPVKELKRLIKLLSDREENEGMKDKWRLVSKYFFLIKFKPKLFKKFIIFLLSLNLEELKMDEDDTYHAKTKVLFNWET